MPKKGGKVENKLKKVEIREEEGDEKGEREKGKEREKEEGVDGQETEGDEEEEGEKVKVGSGRLGGKKGKKLRRKKMKVKSEGGPKGRKGKKGERGKEGKKKKTNDGKVDKNIDDINTEMVKFELEGVDVEVLEPKEQTISNGIFLLLVLLLF